MKDILVNFLSEQGFFNQTAIYDPDLAIEKNEKVIGDMNDLEKFLYSKLEEGEKTCKAFHSKDEPTLEELESHRIHHYLLKIASEILWWSIKSRLKTDEKSVGYGIRQGFKIVETYEKEESDNIFDLAGILGMMGGVMPGFGGKMTISVKRGS